MRQDNRHYDRCVSRNSNQDEITKTRETLNQGSWPGNPNVNPCQGSGEHLSVAWDTTKGSARSLLFALLATGLPNRTEVTKMVGGKF